MTEAMQDALAAEHAAVFGYGVVGGVLGQGRRNQDLDARAGVAAHRSRRDRLIVIIGEGAVAAEPLYALPFPVRTADEARRLAAELERRCAAVYASVVARTVDGQRRFAASALTDAAVRELTWGGRPDALPGVAEL